MKLLIMAGTSDANQIIKQIKGQSKNIHVTATTVTPDGASLALIAGADTIISHSLNKEEISKVINEGKINCLVDATHPYAAEATNNAISACRSEKITYIRFERPKTVIPINDMIKTVNSFHEAAVLAKKLTDGKIFHLAGVLTLGHILEFIEPGNVVVRVLPSCYSITKCLEMGIPPENIIAMQGTFSKEFNQILMREYSVEAVITKESGITGGTPEKIEAALEVGVPLIIVERPEIPELYSENVHKSVEELVKEIISD